MVRACFCFAKVRMFSTVHGCGGSFVVPRSIMSPSVVLISVAGIMRTSSYAEANSCTLW